MIIKLGIRYRLGLDRTVKKADIERKRFINASSQLKEMSARAEVARFRELDKLIHSEEFQRDKKEVQGLRFKGSKEEAMLLELKEFKKSKDIRGYYSIIKSASFSRFQGIENGKKLERYFNLDKRVHSAEFKEENASARLAGKKKYKTTDEYLALNDYRTLQKDSDIKFYNKFIRSSSYARYKRVLTLDILSKVKELEAAVLSKEFSDRVAYLKDGKRYEKTEACKQEREYKALDAGRFMKKYRRLETVRKLYFPIDWELLLDEGFYGGKLDEKVWVTDSPHGKSFMIKNVVSQADELQCFNGERNVRFNNGGMSIVVREERAEGNAWVPVWGIVPRQFDYTSAVVSTGDNFTIDEGVVEAKLRFKPRKMVTSAFSLKSKKSSLPQIDILRSNEDGFSIGVVKEVGSDAFRNHIFVNGLRFNRFHIFRIEWDSKSIVWKVNGKVIHSQANNFSSSETFSINLLTTLHGQVSSSALPYYFDVGWVRCFGKRKSDPKKN